MKRYIIQTKYNENFNVSLGDIKTGDCYDCGHPEWAWSMDNTENASGVIDNVKAAARLKGIDIKLIDGYAAEVVTCDGVKHRNDAVAKIVEQLLDDETSYDDERGLPYLYAEVGGRTIVIDGEEAWFVDADENEVRRLL